MSSPSPLSSSSSSPSSTGEDAEEVLHQQQPHKETEVKVVPVVAERYLISKKAIVQNIRIEKRWVTRTEKIEVPVKYEEIYVNGKKFGSKYNRVERVSLLHSSSLSPPFPSYSSVNGQIDTSAKGENNKKKEKEKESSLDNLIRKDKRASKSELTLTLEDNSKTQEEAAVLPLFGEEILIRKRIRQVGEVVITKRKVTENKKLPVKIKDERVGTVVRYPDGNEKDIT